MATQAKKKLNIMVASTVYGFEDHLNQICAVLRGYGYNVWNSHRGSVPVDPGKSNLANCVAAAGACDLFLGIIRPFYGSGVTGSRSITHEEVLEAIRLKKPRWVLVHHDVVFSRQLLKQFMYGAGGVRTTFKLEKTPVMDDLRVIEMYNDALQDSVPLADRTGHWVQEFSRLEDLLEHLDSQFKDINRIRRICQDMQKP